MYTRRHTHSGEADRGQNWESQEKHDSVRRSRFWTDLVMVSGRKALVICEVPGELA
jgi:hypothetical protein